MNIDTAFPSTYLKCADLNGQELAAQIDTVSIEDLGDDRKPILHFLDQDKSLALNKTNALEISTHYGSETTDWHGSSIVIYPAKTMFQGRQVDCIRVRVPQNGTPMTPPSSSSSPPFDPPSVVSPEDVEYGIQVIELSDSNNLSEQKEKWIGWVRSTLNKPVDDYKKHIGNFEQKLREANIPLPGELADGPLDDDLPF